MTFQITPEQERQWARPQLERTGPNRSVGGFYRTAEGRQTGLGGVPLNTAEEAVVAAVRLAYKVADTQVERSTRLAERLRNAGDRAVGARSDRKAVDASEQLVFKAMMGALSWLEGLAAEGDAPLKRLITSQYKLMGSMLGVTPPDTSHGAGMPPEAARHAMAAEPAAKEADESYISLRRVRIFLEGEIKRPVSLRRCEVTSADPLEAEVWFYNVERSYSAPLEAVFVIADDGKAKLTMKMNRRAPSGRWKAAVCGEGGEQIGLLEIEL
jgi:hypothetical protein